jgi:hypothetical protein
MLGDKRFQAVARQQEQDRHVFGMGARIGRCHGVAQRLAGAEMFAGAEMGDVRARRVGQRDMAAADEPQPLHRLAGGVDLPPRGKRRAIT